MVHGIIQTIDCVTYKGVTCMILEKELVEFYPSVNTKNGIDLQHLAETVKNLAFLDSVPVILSIDGVLSSSMHKSTVEDCLCISHPDHADYYSIVIKPNNGQLQMLRCGFSKEMDKKRERQEAKEGGKTFVKGLLTGHQPEDGYMGNVVGAGIMMKGTAKALFHGIKALGGSKDKLKEEETWYDAYTCHNLQI